MIKKLFLLCFFILFVNNLVYASEIPSIDLVAEKVILIDGFTGKVLYEKNANERAFPASTTKVLTLITALENNSSSKIVTISNNAAGLEGSTMHLSLNEKYDVTELFYGLMLESGNDCAVAIAEHIAGNQDNFVKLMNATAKYIGAENSNFINASGLPNENHYTTAKDMAMIARYAMTNNMFAQIVGQSKRPWKKVNKYQPDMIVNSNKLLDIYYGANGIKTGYTNDAGRCLIASAKRNGIELIAVIFQSKLFCWNDAMKLFDYGFERIVPKVMYKKGDIIKKIPVYEGKEDAELTVDEDIVLPITDDLSRYKIEIITAKKLFAPVKLHQEAGTARILYDGKEIRKVKIYANKAIEKPTGFFSFLFN